MRHNLTYLALLLTVVFVSCRREFWPETGDAIRFSVAAATDISAGTKADIPTSITTPPHDEDYLIAENNQINIWGFKEGSGIYTSNPITATCNSSNTWECSEIQYWTREGAYKFHAVFPTGKANNTATSANQLVVNYSMMSEQYDLMVASAAVTAAPPKDNSVTLPFYHACSAVRFYICTESGDYTLRTFELKNLFTQGKLAYAGTSSAVTLDEWSYVGADDNPVTRTESAFPWAGNWTIPTDWNASLPTDFTALSDWLYFVPQALEGSQAAIHFTFEVNSQATPRQELDVLLSLESFNNTAVTWAPGKLYAYYIKVKTTAIDLDVHWTDWAAEQTFDLN